MSRLLRLLKPKLRHQEEKRNPYAPTPGIGDQVVHLYLTQAQVDHGTTVTLEIPGIISLDVSVPAGVEDGMIIRILDVLPDGSAILAPIHVVPEQPANEDLEGPH